MLFLQNIAIGMLVRAAAETTLLLGPDSYTTRDASSTITLGDDTYTTAALAGSSATSTSLPSSIPLDGSSTTHAPSTYTMPFTTIEVVTMIQLTSVLTTRAPSTTSIQSVTKSGTTVVDGHNNGSTSLIPSAAPSLSTSSRTMAPHSDSTTLRLGLAIGLPLGLLVVILIGLLAFILIYKPRSTRRAKQQRWDKAELHHDALPRTYRLSELEGQSWYASELDTTRSRSFASYVRPDMAVVKSGGSRLSELPATSTDVHSTTTQMSQLEPG